MEKVPNIGHENVLRDVIAVADESTLDERQIYSTINGGQKKGREEIAR
jgi:hypothetical protein